MNGPVACLFRVKLQAVGAEADLPPVASERFTRAFHVAAQDAEAAIVRARECMRERLPDGEHARVVSVEILAGEINAL